jgi:perosamine synthetase
MANVMEAMRSGWISSLGAFIGQFERGFAALCGTAHGIAVANGTVSLHLALVAAGVGPGDEVIIPSLTFVATANVVRYCGATPVFVDSDPETWQLDPAGLEARITPRTRAIMPVHLCRHPCDMDPILAVAKRHGLVVLEDAAEAHGAEYRAGAPAPSAPSAASPSTGTRSSRPAKGHVRHPDGALPIASACFAITAWIRSGATGTR